MKEKLMKQLNCNEELRNSIPMFIEAFVKYYGEEKREEITEKFSKTLFIGYQSPSTTETILRNLEKIKQEELINKLFETTTLPVTKELVFGDKDAIGFAQSYIPLEHLDKFHHLAVIGEEGRLKEQIEESFEYISSRIPEFTREEYENIAKTSQVPEKYKNIEARLLEIITEAHNIEISEKEFKKSSKNILPLLKLVDENINENNYTDYIENKRLQELFKFKENYHLILKEFEQHEEDYAEYYDDVDNYESYKKNLEDKLYKQIIKENMDLIPQNKREGLEEYLNTEKRLFYSNKYINFIFGYNLSSESSLESFSESADEKLLDDDAWQKETIISNRIKYFKEIGIDLGDNYQDYINNEEVKTNWPSKERIKKITDRKKELSDYLKVESIKQYKPYIKLREEIDSLGLLDKEDGFNINAYEHKLTCVSSNLRKTNNGYESFPLVLINFDHYNYHTEYQDHIIVHELNHLFESSLIDVIGNEVNATCGWDLFCDNITTESKSEDTISEERTEKRSYELFNEIINELIAQEISETMIKEDMYMFSDKENVKYKGMTSYEYTMFMVREFYDRYKNEIIESRSNNNIDIMLNAVGKDNFEKLNQLFEIHNENFSGFKVYRLMEDLKDKKTTPLTEIFNDIMIKKDLILEDMEKHHEKQQTEEKTK